MTEIHSHNLFKTTMLKSEVKVRKGKSSSYMHRN